jgi:hypothetical protein
METYVMSFASSISHIPKHPERTATRRQNWNIVYQEWPNRKAMAKTIRVQEKRAAHHSDWMPCVKLEDIEGY